MPLNAIRNLQELFLVMAGRKETEPVTTAPNLHGVYEKLGEITATLRDVSHTGRNNAQKIDALAEVVIKQGAIHEQVSQHHSTLEKHDKRLNVLEVDLHHRQGAIGLMSWFSRHWPFTILAAALVAAVAWANGKLGL